MAATTTRTRDRYSKPPRNPSTAPVRVPNVETLPCPDHPEAGDHRLTLHDEDGRPVSRCCYCSATWASLDAAARLKGPRP